MGQATFVSSRPMVFLLPIKKNSAAVARKPQKNVSLGDVWGIFGRELRRRMKRAHDAGFLGEQSAAKFVETPGK